MNDLPKIIRNYLPEGSLNKEYLHQYKYGDRVFFRLKKDLKAYPRGTVFWEGGILHGYQRIKRILNLSEGIVRYFINKFYLEEKMDGYNIRIKKIDNRLYAFTRGGLVCPFTMDRLQELVASNFFERYPDYTLCGEVVGPDNPYNSESVGFIDEDIRFYAFDIKDREGRSIPLYERYRIFKEENIQAVRRWGPYCSADIEKIKAIVLELDREGREGVVIKSIDGSAEVKYVTLGSCLRDIEATASFFPELPAGFYMQRLIRLLAILDEFGFALNEEIKSRIANALLEPMMKTIRNVKRDEQIKEFFRIRVNSKDTADALIRHLRRMDVNARLVSIERAGKHYLATFYRVYHRGARLLRKRLKGHGFYD